MQCIFLTPKLIYSTCVKILALIFTHPTHQKSTILILHHMKFHQNGHFLNQCEFPSEKKKKKLFDKKKYVKKYVDGDVERGLPFGLCNLPLGFVLTTLHRCAGLLWVFLSNQKLWVTKAIDISSHLY